MSKRTTLFLIVTFLICLLYFKRHYVREVYVCFFTSYSSVIEEKVKRFNSQIVKPNGIFFAGNSLIESFDLSVFNSDEIYNRGIGGEKTDGLLKRLDKILQHKPSKIFLEIGINAVFANQNPNEILKNYSAIIKKVRQDSPETTLYIHSLMPVCVKNGFFVDNTKANQVIRIVNSGLIELCNGLNVKYIDLHSLMINEPTKSLREELTYDGVHLNNKGYTLWIKTLENYLN